MFLHENNACGTAIGDCAQLIKTFDQDQDGQLTYEDFAQMVLSCDNKSIRCEAQRRPHNRVGRFEPLPDCIEQLLVTIL